MYTVNKGTEIVLIYIIEMSYPEVADNFVAVYTDHPVSNRTTVLSSNK